MERARHYRPDIDGLRAVAVLAVVLFHAGLGATAGGYIGVDVFFVISGYLISGILFRDITAGKFSILDFYERRARRILPALFAAVLASLALGWFILSPDELVQMTRSVGAAALSVSNFWFWLRSGGYFAGPSELLPLLHTWSLAVEEQFYIGFPLLLMVAVRRSRAAAVGSIATLSAVSFALSVIGVPRWPDATFYLLHSRAWELGVGALIAVAPLPSLHRAWQREALAFAGLGAIVAATALYRADTPFPGMAALPPCLGAAALIVAGSSGPTACGRLLSWRPVVFIGLVSYSFYLWHWPALAFMRYVTGVVVLPPATAAVTVLASFLLAVASWRFVEQPFRRPLSSGGFSRGAVFAYSGAGVIALLGVAVITEGGTGFPSRWDAGALRALNAAGEKNPDRGRCFNRDPGDDWCRMGAVDDATARVDFLFWGDSHADALMPAIDAVADESRFVGGFAGRSGCAPLLDVVRAGARQADNARCLAYNQGVLEQLRARDDAPLVVLFARWAYSSEGYPLPGAADRPVILARAGTVPPTMPSGPERNFELFEQSVQRTVSAIRETGREVVLLGPTPEVGWSVPERLARHIEWRRPLPAGPSKRELDRRHGRTDALFRKMAAAPGIRYIPLAQHFCPQEDCHVQLDGEPLYADSHHLSIFGSLTLKDTLTDALATLEPAAARR